MTRWLLFAHVTSVAFWLGGIAALYVLYRKSLRLASAEGMSVAQATARSVINGMLTPSALVVLVTGIVMLVQMGLAGKAKPFWLTFMEQFGGLVALLSAILLTWQVRRLGRAATQEEQNRHWRTLNTALLCIGAAVALVIFVVELRF